VYRGKEKGRVEQTIRYLRTSFIPARTWTDIDDLNRQAALWCRRAAGVRTHHERPELTVLQAWEQEKASLLDLPADAYPAYEEVSVRVGKTPMHGSI
jgi:hypothetical protein